MTYLAAAKRLEAFIERGEHKGAGPDAAAVLDMLRDAARLLRLAGNPWRDIKDAPKDGTPVFLLSKPYSEQFNGETIHHPARAAIGKWDANGTSWVDELGRMRDDDLVEWHAHDLAVTGFWASGGGWFQPNEVTHFAPLPFPPPAT